ncbi:MAG: hypothetical protein A2147_06930 [Chloroflexi bacterium RBG_16_57_8]|nr:MAG: hypothetical protein A2147_06930 [Chloroflexi bacterium RBG_16_57_8]
MTAGHCDDFLVYFYGIPYYLDMRQGRTDNHYDCQWHTNSWLNVTNQFVWWQDGSTFNCTATLSRNNQAIGSTVSKFGQQTYYTCGTLTFKEQTLSYITNCQPTFMKIEDTFGYSGPLAAPGDSGGPCFSGSTALGITSGISGNDVLYYMAINYVDGIGVSVLTSP